MKDKRIFRLIDANLNRALEGLRVCEDILRFILLNKSLTADFKNARHEIIAVFERWKIKKKLLLESRDSLNDPGYPSSKSELTRRGYKNIFFANIQRVKESLRVLEEFSKIDCKNISAGFKAIRYKIYHLEQEAITKL